MKKIILVTGLSVFFAVSGTVFAGGDATKGKVMATSCGNCHGVHGEGTSSGPKLVGLDEAYIVKQLQDFKSGARKSVMMGMFVQTLIDKDIENIAAYYSSLN